MGIKIIIALNNVRIKKGNNPILSKTIFAYSNIVNYFNNNIININPDYHYINENVRKSKRSYNEVIPRHMMSFQPQKAKALGSLASTRLKALIIILISQCLQIKIQYYYN